MRKVPGGGRHIGAARNQPDAQYAARELAETRYASGLSDVITMLEAQRRAFDAEGQYITVRRQRLESRVNLYLALGGDFEIESLKD